MKARMLLAAAAAASVFVAPVLAQHTDPAKPGQPAAKPAQPSAKPAQPEKAPAGMPSPEEMQKYMEAATPGPEHERLRQHFEGTWNVKVTFQHAPGGPEDTSTGTSTDHMVLDGRFVHTSFKGSMNMPGPDGNEMTMPFEGLGYTGFDKVTKKYTSSWMDTMGTGVMHMTGAWDEATKSYTYTGSYEDPVKGTVKMRQVIRIEGPDRHIMDFYTPGDDGKEWKSMTITYTRAAGQPAGRSNAPSAPGNSGNAPGRNR
jgi:hypothetical protein